MTKKYKYYSILLMLTFIVTLLSGCMNGTSQTSNVVDNNSIITESSETNNDTTVVDTTIASDDSSTDNLRACDYTSDPWVEINNNVPYFTDEDKTTTSSFENYAELDALGRCGVAYACIGTDIMPTEKRGAIGHIKPSGWHTVKYPDLISDLYLYNRCHLIAFCLTGENDNEKNLITGTRYLNIDGMLPFETSVAKYMDDNPNNHVLYRVTPIFNGDNLVAEGVLMEGYSIEDNGAGIQFCVFCYNVQPHIQIDYATGESTTSNQIDNNEQNNKNTENIEIVSDCMHEYVLNTKSNKFHKPDCSAVESMSDANRLGTFTTYQSLIDEGYEPCGLCKPE